MIQGPCLPAILHEPRNGRHRCTIGWELKHLLQARLLIPTFEAVSLKGTEPSEMLHQQLLSNRIAFAQAVSTWAPEVVLELSMLSLPDLKHPLRGLIRYTLLLRVEGDSRLDAMESALRAASTLHALLHSCFEEAEFTPIIDRRTLANLTRPFQPRHATWIRRTAREVPLGEALETGPVRPGFGPVPAETAPMPPPSSISFTFPWVPSKDSRKRLLQFLLWQTHPVWHVIRVKSSAQVQADRQYLHDFAKKCEAYRSGSIECRTLYLQQLSTLRDELLQSARALEAGGVDLVALVFTLAPPDPPLIALFGDSISLHPQEDKSRHLLRAGFSSEDVPMAEALEPFWFPKDPAFACEEMAAAFRLPSPPPDELPGVPVRRFRTAFAAGHEPPALSSHRTFLGFNVHSGSSLPVHCDLEHRLRHLYILGMTGTGKSSFMENLVLQDIKARHGLCLIDPHGDLVESVLPKIPQEREKDVILLDLADHQHPFGFNLIQWSTLEERDFIIDSLYQTLDRLYDMRSTGGPIFEANFRNMMKLLMGDRHYGDWSPTIVEFLPLYLYRHLRKKLKDRLEDEETLDFIDELERTSGDAELKNLAPYVTSKFNRFVNDTLVKRVVGQEKTTFDFRDAMDSGKIVLLNLARGRVGPYVSALLTSQIVHRFMYAAMARGALPKERRRPFFLYVDEFQTLPRDGFPELLAEARKYGLGLVLANQYAAQLEGRPHGKEESSLEAILGNVGIFVIFRVGITDAKALASLFRPVFSEQDLKEIPQWQAYVQIHGRGGSNSPFSLETVLDESPAHPDRPNRIRQKSRRQYTKPAAEVDAQIRVRRQFFSTLADSDDDSDF